MRRPRYTIPDMDSLRQSPLVGGTCVIYERDNGISYIVDPLSRPKKIVDEEWGDCAVKAMSLALNIPYLDIVEEVIARQGRAIRGWGTEHHVTQKIMREHGWSYVFERRRLKSASICTHLPPRCILHFNKHMAYCEDNIIHDGYITEWQHGQTIGMFVPPPTERSISFGPRGERIVTLQELLNRGP